MEGVENVKSKSSWVIWQLPRELRGWMRTSMGGWGLVANSKGQVLQKIPFLPSSSSMSVFLSASMDQTY